ncbi:MAG TPA: hypothetical protein VNJ07_14935 [Chitinophagales bacterium]|nr:hypothetical protein [Chitinophagales bacterium]
MKQEAQDTIQKRRGYYGVVAVCYFLCIATLGWTQSADEALRYSELRFGGTARGMGVAGAFGAIGADYSSILTNPGGLALFRNSEAMVTINFDHIKNEATYEGTRSHDDHLNFNLPNLGVVFATKRKKENRWKFLNFALGYNRFANFHSDNYYRRLGTGNSILKGYAYELTGIPAEQIEYGGNYSMESVLAYDAYLVNPLLSDNTKYSTVADNADVNQQISIERRGAIDEFSFALAANYNDKVYFGGYVGIPFLFYRERINHYEQNTASDSDAFNYFELAQRLNTFGIGVNFKMGLIARPLDWLRVGVAFHTPTYYGMNDDFSSSVYADFDTVSYYRESPFGEFHYNLVTPLRFTGSIGFIARKFAFVSFDYERVDYSNANYKMGGAYTDFEYGLNDDITSQYAAANIYRAGVELALDKFRLRGGFAHYDTPYESASIVGDYNSSVNYYTFGTGIRLKKIYLDFAYVRSRSKAINHTVNDVFAYDALTGNKFLFTTGFRF